MLSVKGIYENGQIRLLEPIPSKKTAKVIVTLLEELDDIESETHAGDIDVFDDLVGVIHAREDGSVVHDKYLTF